MSETLTTTGNLVQAADDFRAARLLHEPMDRRALRIAFFHSMDDGRELFCKAVAREMGQQRAALLRGEPVTRRFIPADYPGFSSIMDEIFGIGSGAYPSDLMNDWLYINDLSHILHAETGGCIVW